MFDQFKVGTFESDGKMSVDAISPVNIETAVGAWTLIRRRSGIEGCGKRYWLGSWRTPGNGPLERRATFSDRRKPNTFGEEGLGGKETT